MALYFAAQAGKNWKQPLAGDKLFQWNDCSMVFWAAVSTQALESCLRILWDSTEWKQSPFPGPGVAWVGLRLVVLCSLRSVSSGVTVNVLGTKPSLLQAGCVLWFILLLDHHQSTPTIGQVHLFQEFVAYLSWWKALRKTCCCSQKGFTGWGKSRFTVVSIGTPVMLGLLFINHCMVSHTNTCKPTFAHPV